ncbi:MAG: hypothetical protein V4637_12425 [Pseudomonadota bacterium]
MATSHFTVSTLRISSGVIIWAIHFFAIYSFAALICARGLAAARWLGIGGVPLAIGVATVIAAGALVIMIASALRRGTSSFIEWMSAALAALALIAVLWEGFAVAMVPACT